MSTLNAATPRVAEGQTKRTCRRRGREVTRTICSIVWVEDHAATARGAGAGWVGAVKQAARGKGGGEEWLLYGSLDSRQRCVPCSRIGRQGGGDACRVARGGGWARLQAWGAGTGDREWGRGAICAAGNHHAEGRGVRGGAGGRVTSQMWRRRLLEGTDSRARRLVRNLARAWNSNVLSHERLCGQPIEMLCHIRYKKWRMGAELRGPLEVL